MVHDSTDEKHADKITVAVTLVSTTATITTPARLVHLPPIEPYPALNCNNSIVCVYQSCYYRCSVFVGEPAAADDDEEEDEEQC